MAIDRTGAQALIPEDASAEIIKGATSQSTVLQFARQRPNLTRAQQRVPVLSTIPQAYFVNGDTGLKQASDGAWDNVYFNVEELAVIIPVPENVEADTDYNLVEELMPDIQAAFGAKIDAAVLFGTDKPGSWPASILAGATAAGHTVARGSGADLYDEILGEGGTFALVEADGYANTGAIAAMTLKAALRGLRTTEGMPIFSQNMQDANRYALDGVPLAFPTNGAFNTTQAELINGDWQQLMYAWRQDITMKRATEGVITDAGGNVIFNLLQQDMVAYRFVMRIAFALPNPTNRMNSNNATRYPFAALTPDLTP